MADVVMPQMGESIAEGTIVRWIKKVGDKVERDEPLFEISTDKVDAEIPSPMAGVLTEIRHKEGETVPVNSVVGVIGPAGAKPPPLSCGARCSAAAAETAGRRKLGADIGHTAAGPAAEGSASAARTACRETGRRRAVRRGSAAPAIVSTRSPDRQGAQRRHLRDPRNRHGRPGDEGRHPRLSSRAASGRALRRRARPRVPRRRRVRTPDALRRRRRRSLRQRSRDRACRCRSCARRSRST